MAMSKQAVIDTPPMSHAEDTHKAIAILGRKAIHLALYSTCESQQMVWAERYNRTERYDKLS